MLCGGGERLPFPWKALCSGPGRQLHSCAVPLLLLRWESSVKALLEIGWGRGATPCSVRLLLCGRLDSASQWEILSLSVVTHDTHGAQGPYAQCTPTSTPQAGTHSEELRHGVPQDTSGKLVTQTRLGIEDSRAAAEPHSSPPLPPSFLALFAPFLSSPLTRVCTVPASPVFYTTELGVWGLTSLLELRHLCCHLPMRPRVCRVA